MKENVKDKKLKGALVTGGSRGIGYELAKLAAADGYNPVLVSRSEGKLKEVKEELESQYDVQGKVIPGDLSETETPRSIYEELKNGEFRIDLLINNAGRGQMGKFADSKWEKDKEMMKLNMNAVVHLTKLFLPAMVRRGEGKILNVSSLAAFQPGPLMALYHATKSFVQSFSEALAEEVAKEGITVTALSPGPVDTDFQIEGDIPTDETDKAYVLSAERTARAGYEGLKKGRRIVVPGPLTSVAPQLERFLPRRAVTKFVKKLNENRLD